MAIKAEIGWRKQLEDGTKIQVAARHFGRKWVFQYQTKRFEEWEDVENAPLEDWLELLETVERLIPRRRYTPADAEDIRRHIRESFPEVEIPDAKY